MGRETGASSIAGNAGEGSSRADQKCALLSLSAGEPLAGSAPDGVRVWILLEYVRPWAPKPFEPSELPEAVKAHIQHWLDHVPGTRLQFIRRPARKAAEPLLFIAHVEPGHERLLRFVLDDYAAITALDLATILRDRSHPNATTVREPLHLVCVHGKRDRCCAEYGGEVYRAMSQATEAVWQTTHLGGHRFAACAVALPSGICYGRLREDAAQGVVQAHATGEMGALEHVRGRSAYDRPTQAAEIFLRQRLGLLALDAVVWKQITAPADNQWDVVFEVRGETHRVQLRRKLLAVERPASCGGEPEPAHSFVER